MLARISLGKQDAESSLLHTDGTVLQLPPSARPRGERLHGEFLVQNQGTLLAMVFRLSPL
jgi:hypothetical protein